MLFNRISVSHAHINSHLVFFCNFRMPWYSEDLTSSSLRIKTRVLTERLAIVLECQGAMRKDPYGPCIFPIGLSHFARIENQKASEFLNLWRKKLEEGLKSCQIKIEALARITDNPGGSTGFDDSSTVEVVEQLDDQGNVLDATLNGKKSLSSFAEKSSSSINGELADEQDRLLEPSVNQADVEELSDQSLSKNRGDQPDVGKLENDISHNNILEFEVLAGELTDTTDGISNTEEKEVGFNVELEEEFEEDFDQVNGENDDLSISDDELSDDSYADNVLFGTGMSLIPAHGPIQERLKEELQKVGAAQRIPGAAAEKNVRFKDTLDVKTIESLDQIQPSEGKKTLKFRREHQRHNDEKVVPRITSSNGEAEFVRDVIERTPTTDSESEAESELQKLVRGYYDEMYQETRLPNGPIIDDVTDLSYFENNGESVNGLTHSRPEAENAGRRSDAAQPSSKVVEDLIIEREQSEPDTFEDSLSLEIKDDYNLIKKRLALKGRENEKSFEDEQEPRKHAQSRFMRSLRNPRAQ